MEIKFYIKFEVFVVVAPSPPIGPNKILIRASKDNQNSYKINDQHLTCN